MSCTSQNITLIKNTSYGDLTFAFNDISELSNFRLVVGFEAIGRIEKEFPVDVVGNNVIFNLENLKSLNYCKFDFTLYFDINDRTLIASNGKISIVSHGCTTSQSIPVNVDVGNKIIEVDVQVVFNDYSQTIHFDDLTPEQKAELKGEDGVGIQSIVLNPDYTLTINFTDGTSTTTSSIRGLKGEDGVGILNIQYNPDFTLTIHLTDGSSYTTGNLRGAKGDPFTYEDFTEAQLDDLRAPAIIAAQSANNAATLATTAADNADAKATLAQNAATLANNAADNANNATSLANDATNNANTKAALAEDAATAATNAAAVANGAKGWTPIFSLEKTALKVAMKLTGYTGGTGTAPTDNVGRYLSTSGYVDDFASALNLIGSLNISVDNEVDAAVLSAANPNNTYWIKKTT